MRRGRFKVKRPLLWGVIPKTRETWRRRNIGEEMKRRVKTQRAAAAALKTSGSHQGARGKTLDSAESLGSSDGTARILACFISN